MYLAHETCWRSRTLLGAMFLLVVASCAHSMTIDIFSAQQGPADDISNGGGGAFSNMPGPQAGNVVPFTGSRMLFAEKTSEAIGRARLQVDFDVLFYSSSSGVSGQFEVAYLDLGGINLTFGDGLTILGELDASAAAGGGTRLGLYVEDISANFARSDVLMTTAGAFSHTFDKADFAGVDFSQVETIRLGSFEAVGGNYVDVPTGGDLIIASVETTLVPEPRHYIVPVLAALSLLLVVAYRRRSPGAKHHPTGWRLHDQSAHSEGRLRSLATY